MNKLRTNALQNVQQLWLPTGNKLKDKLQDVHMQN